MAFGSQKAAILGLVFAALSTGAELKFDVRHDHWRKSGAGVMVVNDHGLTFTEGNDHDRAWSWADVQELRVEPSRLTVLTYSDNPWKLGADREHVYTMAGEGWFHPLLQFRTRGRIVAALPGVVETMLWQVQVKHKQKFGGSDGVLTVTPDSIVYLTAEKGQSRTWLLSDIDNISSSGPYDLTITTYERSKGDYGDRRSFNFQLKQRLPEREYNALWRRLNQTILEKQ